MNTDKADAKAKELYGPKAFAKTSHFKSCDVLIDQSWSEGKKRYYQAWLIGWGYTWEEAFAMAKHKYPNLHKKGNDESKNNATNFILIPSAPSAASTPPATNRGSAPERLDIKTKQ